MCKQSKEQIISFKIVFTEFVSNYQLFIHRLVKKNIHIKCTLIYHFNFK